MRAVAIAAILLCAVPGWAQSLGDLVRADRERPKTHARKVITNDNLKEPAIASAAEPATEKEQEPTDPLQRDLFRLRTILHNICADPQTDNGRTVSAEDKTAMLEGVKPLRVRVQEFERKAKSVKDALAALDQDFEAKILKVIHSAQPLTDADIQRVKALRDEHDARRAALTKQAESEAEAYKAFQEQLGPVADECPAAAASVPD